MKPVVQILKDARALIADEKNWTQGALARGPSGGVVSYKSSVAVCFCSIGAIERIAKKSTKALQVVEKFYRILPSGDGLADFNDSHTHAEVLALFDRAIARAESETVQ